MAALWVAAYHLLLPAGLIAGWPARFAQRGYLAVDLFFVLSGFVMALTYGHLFTARFRMPVYAMFLWRRLARLYPIYGAILIGRLAYTAFRYGTFALPRPWIAAPLPHPWTDIPANLLLVQSWGIAPSSIGPAWSISTELAAYCLFPVLVGVMLHRRPAVPLGGAVAATLMLTGIAVALAGSAQLLDVWDGRTAAPLLRCLGGFMFGMGVWRLSRSPRVAALAGAPGTGWAVIGLLVLSIAADIPDPAIYPLFPALVLCLACGRHGPALLLARPACVWLGEISYSLYLLHIFLLHPLDRWRAAARLLLPPAGADLLTASMIAAFLLAAADICHRCIERPGRRWLIALTRGQRETAR